MVSATDLFCLSVLIDNYLRIDSELLGIKSSFDNTSKRNLESIKKLGETWWKDLGKQTLEFIT